MKIMSLGEKIRKIRKSKLMTLKNLAGNKVTEGQISLIEAGKSNPSIDLLKYLAQKLEVSVDYLMESEKNQVDKAFCFNYNLFHTAVELNKLDMAEEFFKMAKDLYDKYQYSSHYLMVLSMEGKLEVTKGNYRNAFSTFIRASMENPGNNLSSYVNLSLLAIETSIRLKEYNTSLLILNNLEKIVEMGPLNLKYLKNIYYFQMLVNDKLANYEKSNEYKNKTLEVIKYMQNDREVIEGLFEKALKFKERDFNQALRFSGESARIIDAKKFDKNDPDILSYIGKKLSRENKFMEATSIHLQELGYSLIKGKMELADVIFKIARQDINMNLPECAKNILSFIGDDELSDPSIAVKYHLITAEVYSLNNENQEALENLQKAARISSENKLCDLYKKCLIKLSEFYLNINRDEEAKKYLKLHMEYFLNNKEEVN